MCRAKETYAQGKRDLCIWQKSLLPYAQGKRGLRIWQKSLLPYVQGKRDLCAGQKRPMRRAKETYLNVKRDLRNASAAFMCALYFTDYYYRLLLQTITTHYYYRLLCGMQVLHSCVRCTLYGQKRPMYRAKETYVQGKRDLCIGQKRAIHRAKETYLNVKRDLWNSSAAFMCALCFATYV